MADVRTVVLATLIFTLFAPLGRTTHTSPLEVVSLVQGSVISLATPPFVAAGKRYAFTWAGGGPAQTYTVKSVRADGWVLVEVADENTNPVYFIPGEHPTRWLNVGTAISIQEMRPHQ